jgi:hypothetical protein
MSKKNRWVLPLALLVAIVICPAAKAALRTLSGHVPAVVARLAPSGRLAATNRLDLAIGLPLRNQNALGALLHDLYDPASPNFHHYLTPEEFTAQFGPTEEDYQAVVEFAQSNGLSVTRRHGNRVLLDVNGNVSDVERAFHVTLHTYRHPTEARDFFAPDTEPSVSSAVPILDISGLSDYERAKPFLHAKAAGTAQPAAGSASDGGYLGQDFRNAYAPGTTLNGFGQMVGLVEFSGYDPADVFAYEAQAGLPDVPLQNVLLDGSIGDEVANGDAEAEVCLDIEMSMAMATNLSQIVVFEAPYTNSAAWLNDILNTMVSSNQIKQFSCSWGVSGNPNQTSDQIFKQMAVQGQSFFQASGDGDAWTSPIWEPAESTNVIVVGGTTLTMSGAGAAYASEQVWNWGKTSSSWGSNGTTNDYFGSGGGVSANYAIPYWQAHINMTTNLGSQTMRNIPDVALTADNIYVTHASGSYGIYGGTSCAAPLWAGFMALVNQQAMGLGNPAAGFINPAIYALGRSTNYAACFHDTTVGSNTWSGSPSLYYAVPGYDLCTGWGTPAGTNLINALAGGAPDELVINPLAGFVAYGPPGGPFSPTDQFFNLNNTGTESLDWTLINTSAWLVASPSLAAGDQAGAAVSLTAAADTLAAGTYCAAIDFGNLTTHVFQPRAFTLQVGQSLVQDGGFESGSFCRWTLTGRTTTKGPYGGTIIWNGVESPHPGYYVTHSGNYGAFLGDTNVSILYQTLPTCPGQAYLLSFWLENPTAGSGQIFEVNWNTNGPMATNTIYFTAAPPAFSWSNFTFVVTAATTNTILQFGAQNVPGNYGLDDISVTPIPSPSFSAVAKATNGLAFTWLTLPNVSYLVQYKTNLCQTNWVNLGNSIIAVTNTLSGLDTNPFTSSAARFYRVSVSP